MNVVIIFVLLICLWLATILVRNFLAFNRRYSARSEIERSSQWHEATRELDEMDYFMGIGPKPTHLVEKDPFAKDALVRELRKHTTDNYAIIRFSTYSRKIKPGTTLAESLSLLEASCGMFMGCRTPYFAAYVNDTLCMDIGRVLCNGDVVQIVSNVKSHDAVYMRSVEMRSEAS